jgi:glycosyltransferase involved in cell wall biosynthesis
MVKNAGPAFEQMLIHNLPYIDKWTILDTGSTDETVQIINNILVGKKEGNLYEEPFINFRDSRNRLLDLAGKDCKFTIMLDDTYVINLDLRSFLHKTRGITNGTSYNIYIKDNNMQYGSNRILLTQKNLRYKYKIHEIVDVINNDYVLQIPFNEGYIYDISSEYMMQRTKQRKLLDLQLLFEEIYEDPDDPRCYYYIGDTYLGLHNYAKSAEFFLKRVHHKSTGFIQEKTESLLQAAVLYAFKLNKPWTECFDLFMECHNLDPERPEPMYYIAAYMHANNMFHDAYIYFKKAFEIGFPGHKQISLKPSMSYKHIPFYLTQLSYTFHDYETGLKASELYILNNTNTDEYYETITSWYAIFKRLNEYKLCTVQPESNLNFSKPILCFIADGGYESWDGSDINKKGIGGSETYIIEMARNIQKLDIYTVIVFCNCLKQSVFENVYYFPLTTVNTFIKNNIVLTCIISRFVEFLPMVLNSNTSNVYIVLHDVLPIGNIIPIHTKLKKIFCLTEWHVDYFTKQFPQLANLTTHFYYGVDKHKFNSYINDHTDQENIQITLETTKIKNKFIYSSFPNRGLLQLLQMWPHIYQKYPDASLHLYCDINGEWVNRQYPVMMQQLHELFIKYDVSNNGLNIYYHSWVNKDTLSESWKSAEYWLYPCTFMETFCLTALEAALSKTLAITNGLAALQYTVGDRGLCIPGDTTSMVWQDQALQELFIIMEDSQIRNQLLEKNYYWASSLSWESRARKFVEDYLSITDELPLIKNEILTPTVSVVENIHMPFRCMADSSDLLYVKNKFWAPIDIITNCITSFCIKNAFNNILEIGPGYTPFPIATHFIGHNEQNIKYTDIDIDINKLPFSNNLMDFIYSRHILQAIQNPDFAMNEILRVSSSGYIETPSPLVEILKGVDAAQNTDRYAGYIHHRYIIWSDIEKGEIYFLPKYSSIIDNLTLPVNKTYLNLVNNYPVYWNNYFIWQNTTPKIVMFKNGVNLGVKTNLWQEYTELLTQAVETSIRNTNYFIKHYT